MNDEDCWIVFDGPEPDGVRPLLAALREAPPAPAPAEREAFIEALMPLLALPEVPEPEVRAPEAPMPAVPAAPPLPPPRPPPMLRTAPMPAMPPGAASPFLPPGAFPPKVRAPPTMPCPVMTPVGRGTTPAGDDSIERAVAAVRSAGSKPAAVPVPALSLAHYASLCAEMAVWPEYPDEIRRKYQVPSPAVHEALDGQWRETAARDPAVRAELTRTYQEYVGWLRGLRAAAPRLGSRT
jgi:hypothetical protein